MNSRCGRLKNRYSLGYEVVAVVRVSILNFWVVTPCSRDRHPLLGHYTLKTTKRSSETPVTTYNTTRCHNHKTTKIYFIFVALNIKMHASLSKNQQQATRQRVSNDLLEQNNMRYITDITTEMKLKQAS